jgi:hypothetical protein
MRTMAEILLGFPFSAVNKYSVTGLCFFKLLICGTGKYSVLTYFWGFPFEAVDVLD